ncbi:hypothetical protein [Caballeronia sordidicola]|uniref:hypothetical protein n=1 Tax=Caballeronia sordidicola TaxID=196367 RepID=UPI000763BD61|nr:hypothetical protein [Caballeronia sordidicola]
MRNQDAQPVDSDKSPAQRFRVNHMLPILAATWKQLRTIRDKRRRFHDARSSTVALIAHIRA